MNFPPDQVIALPINNRLSPIQGGIKSDFSGLEWIKPDAYVGKQSYRGQLCYYYEDGKSALVPNGSHAKPPLNGLRAWIDVTSRLPIAVEDENVLKTYAYRQSEVNVELPDVFATTFESAMKAMAKKAAQGGGALAR